MTRRFLAAAALAALCLSAAATAQVAQPGAFNVETATALSGRWTYRSHAGGSEAAFADAGGTRLTLRCNRAVRTVSIARSGVPAAAPTLSVWTTSLSRSVPARFEASRILTADLAATDPLLDAIAFSKGKWATSALGAPTAAYPAWAEPVRVIEDCRS
jgi:hypothetical protein